MSNSETSIPHKIVDTLLTANIIAKDFSTYVDAFSPMRSDWTAEYAGQLIQRSDDALSDLVGVDHRGKLRKSTDRVLRIMNNARADLYAFKINVSDDFEKEVAEEILTRLGYNRYYQQVQKDDQESLMSLLNNFKNSMSDDLRQLITSGGLTSEFIDKIIAYAPEFQEANLAQEELKNHWNKPSIEAHEEFQSIYREIIKICKIGRIIYRDDPKMQDRFTFSKVLASVSGNRAARKEEEDREAAEDEE